MKRLFLKFAKFIYFFAGCYMMLSVYAYAYFDPSATTYIIQAIGALLVAAGACLTVFRHKITSLFKGDKEGNSKEEIIVEEDD